MNDLPSSRFSIEETTTNHDVRTVNDTNEGERRREHIVMASLCWALFLAGWNDSMLGPLLPRLQHFYNLDFSTLSLVFVCNAVGFIVGYILNVYVSARLSLGKILILGAILQVVGYSVQSAAPPFAVLGIANALNCIGIAFQDAHANALVGSIRVDSSTKMGILHSAYALGELLAPVVSTQFSQIEHWSFHYVVSLGLALLNVVSLVMVFRGKTSEVVLAEIGSPEVVAPPSGRSPSRMRDSYMTDIVPASVLEERPIIRKEAVQSAYRDILQLKMMHILSIVILFVIGVEDTTGGWIVTFIIQERQGGPLSGYISSGFYGGLAVGRILLLWVSEKVGERRVIWLYTIIAIGLEIGIYFTPSLIANGVMVAFLGFILGPMYPICMNQAARLLPRHLLAASIGWIAGFGQVGAAILPFIAGAFANKFSIIALHPLLIAMLVIVFGLWFLVPPETPFNMSDDDWSTTLDEKLSMSMDHSRASPMPMTGTVTPVEGLRPITDEKLLFVPPPIKQRKVSFDDTADRIRSIITGVMGQSRPQDATPDAEVGVSVEVVRKSEDSSSIPVWSAVVPTLEQSTDAPTPRRSEETPRRQSVDAAPLQRSVEIPP